MMKRTDKEKLFTVENTSVFKKFDISQTASDHSLVENAESSRAVSLNIRKREALKRLYLDRYE